MTRPRLPCPECNRRIATLRDGTPFPHNCKRPTPRDDGIGVEALRNNLRAVLDRVKGGEVVTVTQMGRAVARIVGIGGGE